MSAFLIGLGCFGLGVFLAPWIRPLVEELIFKWRG